jgi:hypothetical protein
MKYAIYASSASNLLMPAGRCGAQSLPLLLLWRRVGETKESSNNLLVATARNQSQLQMASEHQQFSTRTAV